MTSSYFVFVFLLFFCFCFVFFFNVTATTEIYPIAYPLSLHDVFRSVALLPRCMFEADLAEGRLLQPFATTLELGRYWLTRLRSRAEREPAKRFREWLQAQG